MAELVLEEALKGSTVDPVEESDTGDYAGDYLLGRQVSREMNDPVSSMALDSVFSKGMAAISDEQNRMSPSSYTARAKPESYLDVNKITYTKKPEAVPGVDYTTPSDTVGVVPGGEGGDFVGSLQGSRGGPSEFSATATHEDLGALSQDQISGSAAIEDSPIIDPAFVASVAGGAGVATSLSKMAGTALWKKLVPSFARGVTNASIGAAAEYGYGAATGVIGDKAPDINPLVFNVALGLAGGLTLETYAVNQLEKMAMRGVKSALSPQNVVAAIRSGDFNNPVARKIAEGWANHVENESGLFFGTQHSKTLDVPLFNRVKESVENGADRKKVRLATGFFQPEKMTGDTVEYGKWKWESSDKNYKADIGKLVEFDSKNSQTFAKDFITHPDLFAAYPEIKNVKVKLMDLPKGRRGMWDGAKNTIYLNRQMAEDSPKEIEGTILHEMQHWIQNKEGFVQGASISNVEFDYPQAYARVYAELKADQASMNKMQADATRLNIDIESVVRANAGFITYKNVGGEVEARDAVERWMFEESMKMENLEPARKLYNEFINNTKKQMSLFPEDLSATGESIMKFQEKMRAMGYDLNKPDIFRAFESGDFKYVLPEPAILRYAKTIAWPEMATPRSVTMLDPRYRKLETPPVKGVTIMPEEISSSWEKAIKNAENIKDSSDIRYINEKQYARDMAERGAETQEIKVARKTLQERDSSIIEQMRNANPPPSLTDKSFFTKPRDEQQAIMQAWRDDLQSKTSKALGEYTPEEMKMVERVPVPVGPVGDEIEDSSGDVSWIFGIKNRLRNARAIINPENDYALFRDGSPSGSLEPSLLPKAKAVSKLKENLTKPQTVQLFSMGPGAMAGVGYDEETQQVTFNPEKAIVGMVLGAGTMKLVGGKLAKGQALGKGITTGGQGGRYLRGTFSDISPAETVAKNLGDSALTQVWDGHTTVSEALEHAKAMTYIKAEISSDPIKLRWRENEIGAYGNDKMGFKSAVYPAGRNTYDIQGCGREAWARQNGVEQTTACYGGKCYAESEAKTHGRGSIASGDFFHGLHWKSPVRAEITQSMKDIGLEKTQAKYPEYLIQYYENKGGETSKLSIKAKSRSTPTAKVSTNLAPANGQDIRLGVDTDGSAWLSEPVVMDALLASNPRTLSVYSSGYFAPPAPHPLSGRTIIDVTVSGWHPLPETLHRLEWAKAARENGWNVVLREVTADPAAFENTTVNLYNRLHKSLMKTDFFVMEQPLHAGKAHGGPTFGLPGCCKADKENPFTCDNCEVNEGLGLGFQKYWGIKEGTDRAGQMIPDVNSTDAVINRSVIKSTPILSDDVTSPFAEIPVAKFRFDPTDIDLPFKDKSVLEEMANINFNNILDEKGIQDAIAQVGRIIEDSGAGEVMRRGTQSNRSTAFKAVNPHLLALEDLMGRKPGQTFNAEEAVRARYFLVSSAQNLVGVAQKAAGLSATDLDKVAFVKALNLHGAIQAQVSGMTAEAGRLLNSFNIMAKSTQGITREVKNVLEALPGGMSVDEMAHFVSTLSTPIKVGKFVTKIQHASTIDMVVEAWINSLLSGPTTHAVNIASNSLAMLLQLPERWAAGQFARALGHEASVVPGETSQMAWGLIEGFRDGLKSAGQVIRTGEATDIMSKVEKPFQKSITSANVRALSLLKKLPPSVLEEGGMTARAIDLLGEAMRIPTTALQAEDSFFKGIGYRMELRARSYRDAVQKYPDDIEKQQAWMQKVMEDPETHAPDIAVAAQNFSRYATFTNELGKYGKGLQQLASHPAMRFIIPFVRTPTNILKFGMERTPFGIIKVIRAGTEAERDLALARMSLGSLAMASTAALASGGFITGGGPTDPERQAALRRTGWQPYSLHIGDKYYSFSRIEPLGMTLGLAADFAEMSALATTDYEGLYEDFGDLGTAIVASIAKNVTSKTWLKGLSAVTMIPSNPEYYGKKWIEGLVGSFVPTLSANVEKAIDPELSAVWGMIDALKARIPGMSRDLPPKRDFWGEPVGKAITENNWLQGLYSMASPVYISESKNSPIDKELVRLKIGLPNPKKTQNIRGIDVPLDSLEYDDFIVKRNQVPVLNGKNLKDSLDYLVGTSQYKEKRAEVKEDMIKDLVQAATDRAKEALYQGNSTLRQYVDQQAMARQREAQ